MTEDKKKVLSVNNLVVNFKTDNGILQAVRDISFDLYKGETLCIVGESGSGKSVTSKAIMGILAKNAMIQNGNIMYDGRNLLEIKEDEFCKIRGKRIGMIFQDPLSSLNPIVKIGKQLTEALLLNRKELKITKAEAKQKAIDIMKEVGISEPEKRFNQYPFEFSGGMRQRIVIAIALMASPEILICDEPTTALDVTIQAQILELINKIKKERDLSCIFITHDLGVVANMADRVAVMYAGKIVEYGKVDEIFYEPKHPYTWALLSSIPDVDGSEKLEAIPGTPPNMINPPVGDAFAERNKYAMNIDFRLEPPFFKVSDTHYAATWLLHPNAPKVEMPKIIRERINKTDQSIGLKSEKEDKKVILSVQNLKQIFTYGSGGKKEKLEAVSDISFDLKEGECLGVVGESGCGKTTTGRSIIGLYDISSGKIMYRGTCINSSEKGNLKNKKEIKKLRTEIQMIFQDPIDSLDPRMTVEDIIQEGLIIQGFKNKKENHKKVVEMLNTVGLIEEHASRYPHEFSGGQRQRIGIARALVMNPKLLICDEPISALDVSIRAQVINLLNDLKKKFGLSIIFIAHDLSVVKYFCDSIIVMYKGKIVEKASSEELFRNPKHPYTKALLSAIPKPDPKTEKNRERILYNPEKE